MRGKEYTYLGIGSLNLVSRPGITERPANKFLFLGEHIKLFELLSAVGIFYKECLGNFLFLDKAIASYVFI